MQEPSNIYSRYFVLSIYITQPGAKSRTYNGDIRNGLEHFIYLPKMARLVTPVRTKDHLVNIYVIPGKDTHVFLRQVRAIRGAVVRGSEWPSYK